MFAVPRGRWFLGGIFEAFGEGTPTGLSAARLVFYFQKNAPNFVSNL